MSHPQAANATPQTMPPTYGLNRQKHPTCWFLAELVVGFPHPSLAENRHCYVSRTEDGRYRVLASGVPLMVSEGVAARHLRRLKGRDGSFLRVAQQQKWHDVWSEAFYGRAG